MGHERPDTQARGRIAAHEHAVGAIIGDDLDAGSRLARLGHQRGKHARGIGRRRALQRDHVDIGVADLIDTRNDAHHAVNVTGPIRQDQDVRARHGGELRVLRHQRPQHRDQLRGVDVLDRQHLRHHFIRGRADSVGQIVGRVLAHVGVRDDLDDIAGGDGDKAVYLQDGQERLVKLIGGHRGL